MQSLLFPANIFFANFISSKHDYMQNTKPKQHTHNSSFRYLLCFARWSAFSNIRLGRQAHLTRLLLVLRFRTMFWFKGRSRWHVPRRQDLGCRGNSPRTTRTNSVGILPFHPLRQHQKSSMFHSNSM
jgi:hypothetical protein